MPTRSSEWFFGKPTKGVKKSLFHPSKKVIGGVMAHNSIDTLTRGNANNNIFNVEKEEGKFASQRFSKKQTAKQFDRVFGTKKKLF